jgi:hypothetical protein
VVPSPAPDGLDLLAVEAYSWSPNLETACEICLCEAALGRRVGFAFLDIENRDEYHQWGRLTTLACRSLRRYRLGKVHAIQRILREHGVAVFLVDEQQARHERLTRGAAGISTASDLRAFRYEGAAIGLGVLSSLIFHCKNIEPDIDKHGHLVDVLLTSAARSYVLTNRLIDTLNPATVLVFNGRFAAAKAIVEAARIRQRKVLFHEVGATKDRYYLSDRSGHSASHGRALLQEEWDRAGSDREKIAAAFFSPQRGGLSLLEARHDDGRKRDLPLAPTGRRRLVYFASSVDEYAAVEDPFDEYLFPTQRAAVEWLVAWVRTRPGSELVIRLHPRMRGISAQERAWWMAFSSGNVLTIPGEHACDSYALARSADRVLTFHSSLGPEATYLGKVSVLLGDAKYRGLDCVYEPATTAELERIIDDGSLPPKPPSNCLPYGYNRVMRGIPYRFYRPRTFTDGTFFGRRFPPLPSRIEVAARRLIARGRARVGQFFTKRDVISWK